MKKSDYEGLQKNVRTKLQKSRSGRISMRISFSINLDIPEFTCICPKTVCRILR